VTGSLLLAQGSADGFVHAAAGCSPGDLPWLGLVEVPASCPLRGVMPLPDNYAG
jgi:hypothetical protein